MPNESGRPPAFAELVAAGVPILGDGATGTRLRLESPLPTDEDLGLVPTVEDPVGAAAVRAIEGSYAAIGTALGLPVLLDAPTWWARRDRLARAGRPTEDLAEVVARCVATVSPLRDVERSVFVGATLGPSVDGYRAEPTDVQVATRFHEVHVEALAAQPVDVLNAATFSTLGDLLAAATALAGTDLPYVLGPVVEAAGTLPDGTPLGEAIERIESAVARPPSHWAICCTHPRTAASALEATRSQSPEAHGRVRQIKGNGSDAAVGARDGSSRVLSDDPEAWATAVIALLDEHGVSVLGGCCGTDDRHVLSVGVRLAQRSDAST